MHRTNRIIFPLSFIFVIGLLVALLIPLATPRTQAASGPSVTAFTGVQAGQALTGRVNIAAMVTGQSISKVVFKLSGPKTPSQTEKTAPYVFFGDVNGVPNGWDTTSYPNGAYTLRATVSDSAGHSSAKSIAFTVANGGAPQPTATRIPPTATSVPPNATPVASSNLIYGDTLASGWANWSWSTSVNFNTTTPKHSGVAAMSATYSAAWGGLFLHAAQPLPTIDSDRLRFWIHGGSGNQRLRVLIRDGSDVESSAVDVAPQAGTWKQVDVPLSAFGSPAAIGAIIWQDTSGGTQPTFYIDDLALISSGSAPLPTATPIPAGTNGPALTVDASADQHPISDLIYGMNFPSEALARELRLPVQRWGGNSTTRYNWQNDTSNHASDWFFENIPSDNANPGALPDGSSSDQFIEQGRRTGTQTLLTIPMIGWTPKSRARTCGFAVSRYGAQQQTDAYQPDCGNGVASNGVAITGNAPQDTSAVIGPTFVQDWMRHLIGRYGTAAQGGVQLYNLDNEPALWNSTHRDVHPQGVSYDELRDRTYQYAAAIKAIDPGAQTLGPAEWGWTGYFYSAKDQQPGGSWWNNPLDRNAHGGTPLLDWYLQQMRAYEQQHGTRILDYLDLHYYPQAGGVALAPAGSSATQALRLRSTRALWDANYTDESWIGEPVRLLPRMRDWVNQNYPGTKLAIGEYNWGALDSMNGALAQADVLGIFGRERLDLATLWAPPSASQPGSYAFRMYRNYDGQGSAFGTTSVRAGSTNQDQLAIYAARRADGKLTLMVINKGNIDLTSRIAITGTSAATSAQVYRYSAANLGAIIRAADLPAQAGGFSAAFPQSSITLLVAG
jgi:hypothetical protein